MIHPNWCTCLECQARIKADTACIHRVLIEFNRAVVLREVQQKLLQSV